MELVIFDCDVDLKKYRINGVVYDSIDFHKRISHLKHMENSQSKMYKDDDMYFAKQKKTNEPK